MDYVTFARRMWWQQMAALTRAKESVDVAGTITNTDNRASSGNSDTYTSSACALGSDDASRIIIVVACPSFTSGTRSMGVTLDGNSMTEITTYFLDGATDKTLIGIYGLAYPSGTNKDVVVSLSDNCGRCFTRVYSTTGLDTELTPFDTATDSADPATLDLNVPAGGVVLAIGTSNTDVDPTWDGVSGDSNSNTENRTCVCASAAFETAQTPLTCGLSWSGATSEPAAIAISLA